MNRPSAEQAKEFDRWMRHWQVELNLQDWRIERGKKPAAKGAMAEVECDAAAHLATYRLGDFGGEDITSDSLKNTALHECLHVFVYDLIATVENPASTPEQRETAEHKVINVLERKLGGL